MRRLLVPLSLALILGSGIFILATSSALPDRVASHFSGLHRAVVDANASEPPGLQESTVYALLAAFTVAIGGWLLAWFLRFRRPR